MIFSLLSQRNFKFKTGLRKAVSVLNSAITMNMALDGESPYDNTDTYRYLQRHMSVMRSMVRGPRYTEVGEANSAKYFGNFSFYTTDGIRLTDTFPIMITDKGAIPYGTAAQRAMYQGQKGK